MNIKLLFALHNRAIPIYNLKAKKKNRRQYSLYGFIIYYTVMQSTCCKCQKK